MSRGQIVVYSTWPTDHKAAYVYITFEQYASNHVGFSSVEGALAEAERLKGVLKFDLEKSGVRGEESK